MFKYDFIILYEHRKRELEDAVLLAMMLEKKGYKVRIIYRRSARLIFLKADVIITPFFYHNKIIIDHTFQLFCHCKKIINMQYEQVFPKSDEEKLNDLPNESGKNAVHISWGKNTTERYKKIGINPDNIFEIGHVSIDLNLPRYRNVFLNKKDISSQFKMPYEKKWMLFISSFSCAGLTKTEYEDWKARTSGTEYFCEISYNTQPIILNLFEKLAQEHPEIEIIYRPHPHETTCNRLTELEKKYDNFRVVTNFSIRQWILVSDYISTWCSTSLVDIYFARKPCAIIRPIPFSEEYDYKMYRNQRIISDYHEIEEFINNPKDKFDINSESIQEYYCNDDESNAFENLCNLCIKVKNDQKFNYNYSKDIHASPLYLLMIYIYKILLLFLAEFIDYSRFVPERYRADVHYAHKEMNKYKDEIAFYRKRFSKIV